MKQEKWWEISLAASALAMAACLLGWLAFQAIALPLRIAYRFGETDASMRCVQGDLEAAKESLIKLKSTGD